MKKMSFSELYGLQQAVIARIKTMTRRVDKRLNDPRVTHISEWGLDEKGKAYIVLTYIDDSTKVIYPAYQIGEEVAVAQRLSDIPMEYLLKGENDAFRRYLCEKRLKQTAGYTNKMFVYARFMPHRIHITDIKVERLQDISDEDIVREGIMEGEFMNTWDRFYYDHWGDVPNHITFKTPRTAFASLIDKVSGKGTWDANPWMFAYKFELIK